MAKNTDLRREALRIKLIDIAQNIVADEGPGGLKARRLADQAGCAVGAIYNAVGDMEAIAIAVNSRTFTALGAHINSALEGTASLPPTQRLITMAHAYLGFAIQNPRAWRALFTLRMSDDMDVPEWYRLEMLALFSFISGPIKENDPDLDDHAVDLMTRALFSSVHGIVLLGLENRISAVPRDQLEAMIALLLTKATSHECQCKV